MTYSDDHNPLNGRPPANRMNPQTWFQMPLATGNHSKSWRRNQAKASVATSQLDSFKSFRRFVTLTTGAGNTLVTSSLRRSGKH